MTATLHSLPLRVTAVEQARQRRIVAAAEDWARKVGTPGEAAALDALNAAVRGDSAPGGAA